MPAANVRRRGMGGPSPRERLGITWKPNHTPTGARAAGPACPTSLS
jgi:hypothetical protein